MLKLIKFELFKQIRRKENIMLVFMFFIPLLYSIGVASNSTIITYNSNEAVTGLGFASSMYMFVYMVFIFYLIVAINSTNILKGEIDNGSISIVLTRINDRNKIYRSKLYAQTIYWIGATLLFIVFSICCYYLFISKLEIASGELMGKNYLIDIMTMVALCSSYILAMSMVQSISMYFKTFVSIGIFIVAFVVMLYLKEFPYIKFLSPLFYLENLLENGAFSDFIKYMAINWVMVAVFASVGIKKFTKSDL